MGFWGVLIIIVVEYSPNPILSIKAPLLGFRVLAQQTFPKGSKYLIIILLPERFGEIT